MSYDADEDSGLDFFKGLEPCEIALAIKSMGDRLNIWPEFQHKLFRYLKHKIVEPMIFTATVLAEALDIGYDKMADQSHVSLTALRTTHDDYLYVENLMGGNAVLSDYIDQLPVSRAWDLYENKRVADGDGQKFVTKFHTLQSRFSAKYYRTLRGISIYSIVANHIPINAQVIGTHEHESQFLFDVLYNNSSHIPIDFITGHILNVVNDSELRKVIKTARNRTESYHQLQRGLRKVGSGLFKGRRIVDNQNGVYLRLVKKYGEAIAQSIMTSISTVGWSHIVFTGRYHFKNQTAEANFEALIARLEKNLLVTLAVTELQGF